MNARVKKNEAALERGRKWLADQPIRKRACEYAIALLDSTEMDSFVDMTDGDAERATAFVREIAAQLKRRWRLK